MFIADGVGRAGWFASCSQAQARVTTRTPIRKSRGVVAAHYTASSNFSITTCPRPPTEVFALGCNVPDELESKRRIEGKGQADSPAVGARQASVLKMMDGSRKGEADATQARVVFVKIRPDFMPLNTYLKNMG